MSWFDAGAKSAVAAIVLAVSSLALQACQVQPLYSSSTQTAEQFASIGIEPVNPDANAARVEQELRNRLIFLFSGGRGEPVKPDYTMALQFRGTASQILREQLTRGITAQRFTATATFTLTDNRTKQVVGSGTRRVVTFYDQTTQEFANRRALRDAENRAAEQLAEVIRADTASILSR